MANRQIIGVYPPQIDIQDVVKGGVYTSSITVKNLDVSAPHTVRVKGPATKWFSADGINQTHRLAPGIATTVQVRLDTHAADADRDYNDALIVRTDAGDIEVPIKGLAPRGQLQLQGSLDFGIVPHESTVEQQLLLTNTGSQPATYQLQWDKDGFTTFTPAEGTIPAGDTHAIAAKLLATEVRSITGELVVTWSTPGYPGGSSRHAYGATIVPQSYQLVEPGCSSAVTKVEFGQLYYGESTTREVVLVNTGPAEAKFDLSFGAAADMQAFAAEANAGGDSTANFLAVARVRAKALECTDHIVDVTPLNGVIPAFSHTTLRLTFSPKQAAAQRGFTSKALLPEQQANSYNYLVQITVNGTCSTCCGGTATATLLGKSLRLAVAGEGLAAAVRVDPQVLHFGRVPCHEWADQVVQVHNVSQRSVLVVVDKGSANFQVEPPEFQMSPNAKESVLVRYLPKALGQHDSEVKFQVISKTSRHSRTPLVLSSVSVAVMGSSLALSTKRSLPGGPEAVPENFTKQRKYVDEADAAVAHLIAGRTFRRPKIWEPPLNAWTLEGIGPQDKYGVMKEVHMARSKHADQYTTFIRAGRTAKAQTYLTRKEGDETDVDLGMTPYRGLNMTAPKGATTIDPLWTAQQTQQAAPTIKRPPADSVLASIPAYKQHPDTPAERTACSTPLEHGQLNTLVVGPRVLDYGKLSPSSSATQCFVVTNPLSVPVHVVMDLMGLQDVRCAGPVSQVVPPGATAKWPLELRSHDVRSIRQKLEYCINGCHFFPVDLTADIVPVTLKLNTNELGFAFDIDDWDASVSKYLMMENPNSFPAEFAWEVDSSVFTVSPVTGTVKPHGSLEVLVTWQPKLGQAGPPGKGSKPQSPATSDVAAAAAAGTAGAAAGSQAGVRGKGRSTAGGKSVGGMSENQTSATMTLRLKGGSDVPQRVQLTGELPAGALKFKEKEVQMGGVPVGARQESMVRLNNVGDGDAAYRVSPASSPALSLSVPKGVVPAGSSVYIWVRFEVDAQGPWSAMLELEVQGGKPLRLPVKAEGIVPHVELLEQDLSFPDTFIGSSNKLPITLRNTAPVPATLLADFTAYPDFQLLLSREAWAGAGYEACPVQKIGANGEISTMGSKRVSRRSSRLTSSNVCTGLDRPAMGYRFLIKMNPSSSLPMMLSFQPSKPHTYNFPAPFMVDSGLGGAVVSHNPQGAGAPTRANASLAGGAARAGRRAPAGAGSFGGGMDDDDDCGLDNADLPPPKLPEGEQQLNVPVRAVGVQPQLVLSKTLVEFGSRIVIRSHQRSMPYTQALYVRNNTEAPLEVHFGPPSSDKLPGCLGVFKLEGAEDTTLAPEEGMELLLVFEPKDARLYEAKIPVYTHGNLDTPHLHLEANGTGKYPKLTFDVPEVMLPPVPVGITTYATFHIKNQGYDNLELATRLPADTSRLPLTLEFPEGNLIGLAKETLPVMVSFCSTRPISFCAALEFLDEEGRAFKLPITGAVDNSLLTLQTFMQANGEGLSVATSEGSVPQLQEVEGGYDAPPDTALGPLHTSPSVPKYLSAVCTRTWPADVRAAFCSSKGRLLQELVETFSGRSVPVKVPKAATNKTEGVQQLLVLYDTLLSFLKAAGAMLAAVQPEMLLEQADFDLLMEARTAAAAGNEEEEEALDRWSHLEECFDVLSAQAWNTVFNQVLRVFVLGRITPEALRQQVQAQMASHKPAHRDRSSVAGAIPGSGTGSLNSSMRTPGAAATLKLGQSGAQAAPDATAKGALSKTGTGTTPLNSARGQAGDKNATAGSKAATGKLEATTASAPGDTEGDQVTTSAAGMSLEDALLSSSNLYSTSECCLLAWLGHNLALAFPQLSRTLNNFDVDLSDGIVLFAVLLNHWPPLARHKGRLHQFPADPRQIRENAELVVGCMQELKLPYDLVASDVEAPDAQDMLLLATYLFTTLPQLAPRTTVDLASRLGDGQIRDIELALTNRRAVTYSARIDGPACFSVDPAVLRVDPGRPCSVSVKFSPGTSKPQFGRLVLMNKREVAGMPAAGEGSGSGGKGGGHKDTGGGGKDAGLSTALAPAIMVFQLAGAVLTQQPLKRVDVMTPLYELTTFDISVTNPYPVDCEFTITVKHTGADTPQQAAAGAGKGAKGGAKAPAAAAGRGGAAPKDASTVIKGPSAAQHPDPFGVDRQRLRLRAGTTEKIKGSYLPFTPGTHRALLSFADAECGEFCYELCGAADLPAAFLDQKALIPLEGLQTVEVPLNFVSHQLENARRLYAEKHPLGKEKEQLVKLRADIGALDKDKGERTLDYTVTCSSKLIAAPQSLTLRLPVAGGGGGGGPPSNTNNSGNDSSRLGSPVVAQRNTKGGNKGGASSAAAAAASNVLKLSLRPVGTGTYPAQLVLTSNWDVRVVEVTITAQCMGQQALLELEAAARQSVVQEITAVNTHDGPITVAAHLKGAGYSGPKDLALQPGAHGVYPLTFTPPGIGTYQGVLELVFPHTGEKNVYTLIGKGGDPLAQGHIPVDCQARCPQPKRIAVPNIIGSTPARFDVMCDLDCISGPEAFTCASTRGDSYTFTVNPLRSGVFQGTLSFVAPDGQYCWYSLEVRATEPPESGSISVQCPVHKAVSITIDLTNPLDKPVTFKAFFNVPELVGPSRFQVPPGATGVYECYFAPLLLGSSDGIVRLINDEVGEFWWRVHMEAIEGGLLELPPLSAAFGRSADLVIPISNPLDVPAVFNLRMKPPTGSAPSSANSTASNSSSARRTSNLGPGGNSGSSASGCFSVSPAQLKLEPYENGECVLTYRPSQLGKMECGRLVVHSDTAGSLLYDVEGQGELPSEPEPVKVSAALNTPAASSITWTNPCSSPATLEVALLCSEAPGSFALLLKGDRAAAGSTSAAGSPGKGGAASTSSSGWSKAREGVKGRESTDSRPTSASSPSAAAAAAAGKGIMQKLEEAAAGVGGKAGGQDDAAAAPLLPPLADCVTVTVPPGGTLDIPLSFCPALLQQYKAQVAVLLSSPVIPAPVPLVWRYSVTGEPHADTQGLAFSFKAKARQAVEDTLVVPLPGLGALDPASGVTFSHELVAPPQYAAALAMAMTIEPLDDLPVQQPPGAGTAPTCMKGHGKGGSSSSSSKAAAQAMAIAASAPGLRYKVTFRPLKALSATAQLVVSRSSGGAWSYDVHVQASPPDVDGVIQLEAHMGCTAEVPLPLYASGATPQEFTADFTPETPLCFDVRPARGLLPPAPSGKTAAGAAAAAAAAAAAGGGDKEKDKAAAPITVLFTSKELGKTATGRLVVVTPDSQYTYELQGRQPAYVPPTAKGRPPGSFLTATTASAAAKGLGLSLTSSSKSAGAGPGTRTITSSNKAAGRSAAAVAGGARAGQPQSPTKAAAAAAAAASADSPGSPARRGGSSSGTAAAGGSGSPAAAARRSSAGGLGGAPPHRNYLQQNIRAVHNTASVVYRGDTAGGSSPTRATQGGRKSTAGDAAPR